VAVVLAPVPSPAIDGVRPSAGAHPDTATREPPDTLEFGFER
jgi:hypothetical protein